MFWSDTMSMLKQISQFAMKGFVTIYPLLLILFSILYVNYLNSPDLLLTLIIYIFILVNQFIENQLTNRPLTDKMNPFIPNILLELVNLGLIIFLGVKHSPWIAVLLLMYTIIVHIQFIFVKYNLAMLSIIILTLFNSFILPFSIFHLHLNFIPAQLIRISVTYIIPIFMLEYERFARKLNRENILHPIFNHSWQKKIISLGLISSLVIAFLILWPTHTWWTMILLTIPLLTILWHVKSHSHTLKHLVRKHFIIFIFVSNLIWTIHFTFII